jgi:hypothetical protein
VPDVPHGATAAALAAVLLALVGCAEPREAPVTQSASASASSRPTPGPTASSSATARPTPSPSAPASPSEPAASAMPTQTAAAAARYCGDAFILDRPHLVWWEGDEAAQLASANAQPVFEPPEALGGLEVQCVATFSSPVDGDPGGVVRISEAFVENDASVFATLEAWAAANGYERATDDRYPTWERAATGGATSDSMFWAPIDDPMIGRGAEIVSQTGVDPDAITVWHGVYTAP